MGRYLYIHCEYFDSLELGRFELFLDGTRFLSFFFFSYFFFRGEEEPGGVGGGVWVSVLNYGERMLGREKSRGKAERRGEEAEGLRKGVGIHTARGHEMAEGKGRGYDMMERSSARLIVSHGFCLWGVGFSAFGEAPRNSCRERSGYGGL